VGISLFIHRLLITARPTEDQGLCRQSDGWVKWCCLIFSGRRKSDHLVDPRLHWRFTFLPRQSLRLPFLQEHCH